MSYISRVLEYSVTSHHWNDVTIITGYSAYRKQIRNKDHITHNSVRAAIAAPSPGGALNVGSLADCCGAGVEENLWQGGEAAFALGLKREV